MTPNSSPSPTEDHSVSVPPSVLEAGRDAYIGNSIVNSHDVHIGPEGLDEIRTAEVFKELLQRREDADHLRAAEEFLAALARFGRPSYETLALRFPAHITDMEEIYVPLKARRPDGTSESLLLSEAMRLAFQSERRMLFVEGAPGSGKSTLIRQMTRNA